MVVGGGVVGQGSRCLEVYPAWGVHVPVPQGGVKLWLWQVFPWR